MKIINNTQYNNNALIFGVKQHMLRSIVEITNYTYTNAQHVSTPKRTISYNYDTKYIHCDKN